MKSSSRLAAILSAVAATFIPVVHAATVTSFDDITYWVGSGSNQAGLVIDWYDGQEVTSYAWGYRWNGAATGEDMFRAIAGFIGTDTTPAVPDGSGDPALTLYTIAFVGFGNAAYQIVYLSHSEGGFDPDTSGYWGYYVADGTSDLPTTWTYSEVGMGDRNLANSSWDGWAWAPDFVDAPPTEPVAAVPEPGSVLLFALGTGILLWQFRRRNA